MKIPRITMLTLGVSNLEAATRFYETVLDIAPNTSYEGVVFFELPGTWISLYPVEKLAEDIASDIDAMRSGFSGFTMAHNVESKEDVIAIIDRARSSGAKILKEPGDVFWGGFNGYFSDPDGYYWEVAWGPMFEINASGELRFKENT